MTVLDDPQRRRRGSPRAVLAVAVGIAVGIALSGCGSAPRTPAEQPPPSVSAAADGILAASAWPDACALGAAATTVQLTGARETAGTLPDGTPLPGPRECRWTLDGAGTMTLRVVIVTLDVLEAWTGYQYTVGIRREVSNIADEAFLTPLGAGGDQTFWVCKGLTIFTLETRDVPATAAQEAMFDVAIAAAARIAPTPAGARPAS